jgi:hypothetical protein
MSGAPRPLFLLSLPRSGSTLLQRLLAMHPRVATAAEPWLLLPLLYTLRRPGVYAEYGHRSMVRAVEDFYADLDGGRALYLAHIRDFALSLYTEAASGAEVFVDKTPRYHLIAEELMETFPGGRFVVLWRNPLAVAGSIVESFGRGHWNLEKFSVDLVDGMENLTRVAASADPRLLAVRYEDMVADPDAVVGRIFAHAGLEPLDAPVGLEADRPSGRMGDRTGAEVYGEISVEPLGKWQATLGTAYRRRWARRYLDTIGARRLSLMGYDHAELAGQVRQLSGGFRALPSDLTRSAHGRIRGRMADWLITPSRAEQRRVAAATEAAQAGERSAGGVAGS